MSAPDTTSEAGVVEPRRNVWRVLKLHVGPAGSGAEWYELPALSGEGEYGYRPSVTELGEAYGDGQFLLVEAGEIGDFLSAKEYEIRSRPTYYSAADARWYEGAGEGEGELDG